MSDADFRAWQAELNAQPTAPWTGQLHRLSEPELRAVFDQHGASIRTATRLLATTAAAAASATGGALVGLAPGAILFGAVGAVSMVVAWPHISRQIGLDNTLRLFTHVPQTPTDLGLASSLASDPHLRTMLIRVSGRLHLLPGEYRNFVHKDERHLVAEVWSKNEGVDKLIRECVVFLSQVGVAAVAGGGVAAYAGVIDANNVSAMVVSITDAIINSKHVAGKQKGDKLEVIIGEEQVGFMNVDYEYESDSIASCCWKGHKVRVKLTKRTLLFDSETQARDFVRGLKW